jgi:uncharacterized protein
MRLDEAGRDQLRHQEHRQRLQLIYRSGIDDLETLTVQLGRPPRGLVGVVVRCPFGRPAVVEQRSYLDDGTPFPTTFYLTCPAAVTRVGQLESGGGVARYEALVAGDESARAAWHDGAREQRRLRRAAARMADDGASFGLGIGGTHREGAVKCLHAHIAFALAQPGYALGEQMAAEAAPLFPEACCCP